MMAAPMSDEQIQEIRGRITAAWDLPGGFDVLYGDAETVVTGDIYDLIDEVERLRAVNATQREIVAAVAEMHVEGDIFDQPFYALMSDAHERNEDWHQQLITKAQSLLAAEEEA